MKFAVFVHLFYQDLWNEISSYLNRIPFKYDLYVTICSEHSQEIAEHIKSHYPNSVVLAVPNRGADVGPFFEKLNYTLSNDSQYDWILKIHSKKSLLVSPTNGERWRKADYSKLLPTDFSKLNSVFLNNSIGMIGAKEHLMGLSSTDRRMRKNNNIDNINYFLKRLEVSDSELKFFGGTMFWIRYSVLKDTFTKFPVTINDFGKGHAPDGTKAHAMERVFANIVRDKKYQLFAI